MKRFHFYEEGEEAWSMAMSLAMELEARERSSSRKNEHGKS